MSKPKGANSIPWGSELESLDFTEPTQKQSVNFGGAKRGKGKGKKQPSRSNSQTGQQNQNQGNWSQQQQPAWFNQQMMPQNYYQPQQQYYPQPQSSGYQGKNFIPNFRGRGLGGYSRGPARGSYANNGNNQQYGYSMFPMQQQMAPQQPQMQMQQMQPMQQKQQMQPQIQMQMQPKRQQSKSPRRSQSQPPVNSGNRTGRSTTAKWPEGDPRLGMNNPEIQKITSFFNKKREENGEPLMKMKEITTKQFQSAMSQYTALQKKEKTQKEKEMNDKLKEQSLLQIVSIPDSFFVTKTDPTKSEEKRQANIVAIMQCRGLVPLPTSAPISEYLKHQLESAKKVICKDTIPSSKLSAKLTDAQFNHLVNFINRLSHRNLVTAFKTFRLHVAQHQVTDKRGNLAPNVIGSKRMPDIQDDEVSVTKHTSVLTGTFEIDMGALLPFPHYNTRRVHHTSQTECLADGDGTTYHHFRFANLDNYNSVGIRPNTIIKGVTDDHNFGDALTEHLAYTDGPSLGLVLTGIASDPELTKRIAGLSFKWFKRVFDHGYTNFKDEIETQASEYAAKLKAKTKSVSVVGVTSGSSDPDKEEEDES